MNILLVHNYYKQSGGEDTVFHNEKAMLEKHGLKVFTYTRHNSELDSMNLIKKVMLPFETVFSLKTYNEVRKLIKTNNIDVIHVHNTLTLISPSVYYAAFSMNIPVVQTIHNFRLLCPAATFYRNGRICEDCPKKGLHCSVIGRCYRGSLVQTLVSATTLFIHRLLGTYRKINYICLTQFNKEKLLMLNGKRRKLIDEDKVYIKPNFINEELVSISGNSDISRDETFDNKDYYIYAARLEALKGIKLVVKAFKENGKKLLVLGTGDQEDVIKKYIEKNKCNNIILLGQKTQEELHELLCGAKALIIGSQWYEGLPVSILEAYSHGIPVIGGNIGNVADVIIDGITGYAFTYNSYKSLNEAIDRFENSDIKILKNNAKKEYLENYSEEKNYNMLMDIYNKSIENRN